MCVWKQVSSYEAEHHRANEMYGIASFESTAKTDELLHRQPSYIGQEWFGNEIFC